MDGNATGIPWQYIGGIADAFKTHGYCAKDNWINTASQAVLTEGPNNGPTDWLFGTTSTKGTLHPNLAGQQAIAHQLLNWMKPDLIPAPGPSGPPPAPSFSTSTSVTDSSGAVTASSVAGAGGWLTGCTGSGCVGDQPVFQMGAFDAGGLQGAGLLVNGAPVTCSTGGTTTGAVTCTAALRADGTYTWDLSFAADGVYDLAFDVKAKNGTLGTDAEQLSVDTQAPSTPTVTVAPALAASGWYTSPVTVTFDATDPGGGSGLQGIEYSLDGSAPTLVGGRRRRSPPVRRCPERRRTSGTAPTPLTTGPWTGRVTPARPRASACRSTAPRPTVTCGAADAVWHADDVSLQCDATDTVLRIRDRHRRAPPHHRNRDAVHLGPRRYAETANALTDGVPVCDLAGNCTAAGPIGANMVDKAGPTFTVTTPADGGTYYVGQPYHADYKSADLSGVASCAGSLAVGAPVDTSTEGSYSFSVTATDDLGHSSQLTTSYAVVGNPTLTAVSSSANPSTFGQAVTFTATVSPAPGSPTGTPTGSVGFYDNTVDLSGFPSSVLLGSGTLNANGVATFSTAGLSSGVNFSHSIVATYAGDALYGDSSGSLTQIVHPAPTSTTVWSSPNPSASGQAVTFTATVTPTDGNGDVAFAADGSAVPLLGCGNRPLAQVNGSYVATCTTSSLAAGNHAISAAYGGSFGYAASSGSLAGGQQVNGAATTTAVLSSPDPSTYGQAATFTATVTGSDGAGTVAFAADGSTVALPGCASQPLIGVNGSYQATCTTSSLAAGQHAVSVAYSGDIDSGPSSSALTQTVNPAPLVVTASSGTMTYGGSPPVITPSYSGFVNGDGAASLTHPPTCTTAATSGSPVGPYPTSCSGAAAANYTLTYLNGTLTVTPAQLTVTASNATMTYGGSPPIITPSYSGFVNGSTLTTPPTCVANGTPTTPAGVYPSLTSCSGGSRQLHLQLCQRNGNSQQGCPGGAG